MPEELGGIPLGHAGSGKFEGWVLRALRLLFSGQLTDIDLKPNPAGAMSQRDVVGTNATISAFWKRGYEDYKSRQVVFECKNCAEVTPDDFRQVLDYTHHDYGRFAFIVRRGTSTQLTQNEQDLIRAVEGFAVLNARRPFFFSEREDGCGACAKPRAERFCTGSMPSSVARRSNKCRGNDQGPVSC